MDALSTDPFAELQRALCVHFVHFAGRAEVEELRSRSWASVTFTGARIELRLKLNGAGAAGAADRFLADLPEAEFALRGHILADISLCSERRAEGGDEVELELEALTVEDC